MKRRKLHCCICILLILPLLYGIYNIALFGSLPRSLEGMVRHMEREEMRDPGEILACFSELGSADVLIRRGDRLTMAFLHGEYRHGKNRYYSGITADEIPDSQFLKTVGSSMRIEDGNIIRENHLIFPAPDENAAIALLTIEITERESGETCTWHLSAERNPDGYYDFAYRLDNVSEKRARMIQRIGTHYQFSVAPYEATGTLALLDAERNNLEIQTFPMTYREYQEEESEYGA